MNANASQNLGRTVGLGIRTLHDMMDTCTRKIEDHKSIMFDSRRD